ncbi:amidohydrolase family protein [Acetobacteraceae bacterium KSS8]|uniref:Amidohydrolase family protein n=1 Tax=Endosaccharibacter trunci TaxID=2812733 RepID=A0ABT1W7T2_9PROT|nr:amidohydrolase family protein [Acetobacteraceae bacterium KSS8]
MRDLLGCSVLCDAFHAPAPGAATRLRNALIRIDRDGVIERVLLPDDPGHGVAVKQADRDGALLRLDGFLLPGFVDLHVHAPQIRQLGQALDLPLEEWLLRYTFPLEARFADLAFAETSYAALVADLLDGGTTTAVYFGTLHGPATLRLAELCVALGQRAMVGRVAMDRAELCPAHYRDLDANAALDGTLALIERIASIPDNRGLVRPIVTPRFVPACTDALLDGLGEIVRAHGCAVQTHCSESDWAHNDVLQRFGRSDAAVLDGFGLLTRRTVLAHGVALEQDDMDLIARKGAGVAHCALSNAYFAGAVFPLRAALARGVRVGLGTDISGGPSASMFEAARMAVAASRMLESGVDPSVPPERRGRPGSRIDIATAFHLATAGGAAVLDLPVGRFAPGMLFDAIRIDPHAPGGTLRVWGGESDADLLATLLYGASRANVASVWTGGRLAGRSAR